MILAINWTEAQIEEIVKKVVIEMNGTPSDIPAYDAESYGGRKFIGIFEERRDRSRKRGLPRYTLYARGRERKAYHLYP